MMSNGWGVLVRIVSFLGLALLLAGVVVARRKGGSIGEWQVSLLVTELGHFLALGALLLAGVFFFGLGGMPHPAVRWGGGLAGLLLAGFLWQPAWQASRIADGFSVARLYLPGWGNQIDSVTVEEHVYREGDGEGPPLKLIICRPKGEAAEDLPWVVSIHGGGWNSGRPDEFLRWDRELASHGFVVVMPEYRLAPENQWPSPREDIRKAINWMRARSGQFGIDPDDLSLLGRSAGGQIASATAFGMPDLNVRRCVAFYAPHDMFFARKYARADDVLDSLKLLREYLGGEPEDMEEIYESASAISLVSPQVPPTLLIHGTRDTLVWVKQSRRLTAKMEAESAPVRFHELPWATHACDYFPFSPGGQVTMQATIEFLESEP